MEGIPEPADLVRGLAQTLERIGAVARGLSEEQLCGERGGEWPPNGILSHLRATADVFGEQIDRILNEETPGWRHVSPRARMKKVRYREMSFAESFAAFAQQRTDLVALLGGITPEAWQRIALVRVEKREWRLSLHERVRGMVHHEEIHCGEMERAAAALMQAQ